MSKPRPILAAGLGAITPAVLIVNAASASAPIADDPAVSGAIASDQEALKCALLALSPTEKLRIAGDRIRLAQTRVLGLQKGPAGGMAPPPTSANQVAQSCGGACVQQPKMLSAPAQRRRMQPCTGKGTGCTTIAPFK